MVGVLGTLGTSEAAAVDMLEGLGGAVCAPVIVTGMGSWGIGYDSLDTSGYDDETPGDAGAMRVGAPVAPLLLPQPASRVAATRLSRTARRVRIGVSS